jgi:excisionase family DNA binding protein
MTAIERCEMTILTIEEAAAFLKVTKRTLYRHGEIPRVKVGGQLRFIQEDLERWVRMQSNGNVCPSEPVITEDVPAEKKSVDRSRRTLYHRTPLLRRAGTSR